MLLQPEPFLKKRLVDFKCHSVPERKRSENLSCFGRDETVNVETFPLEAFLLPNPKTVVVMWNSLMRDPSYSISNVVF